MQDATVDDFAGLKERENNFPNPTKEGTNEKEEDIVEDFGLRLVFDGGGFGSRFHDV